MKSSVLNIFKIACIGLLVIGATACSSKKKPGPLDPGYLSEQDLNSQLEGRFADGSIPTAEGEGPFRNIHFAYNSSSLDDMGRQDVEYNVEILKTNPEIKLILEGHCDERGTAEYNMALGEERSRTVSKVLQSYGVSADKIKTISYGEEVPVAQGSNEETWTQNRRVHFSPHR
ncbi:MAG: OmpA family protein [bacterium]|nr:OmpA family protein [bacterium]